MLSVVITCHNDTDELRATIDSLRHTSGTVPVEVIAIDDGSPKPVPPMGDVRVIRNNERIGVGPSRHIGVMSASHEYVLLLDSHMRFEPGWADTLLTRLSCRPRSIICCTCVGLSTGAMDMSLSKSIYAGGTINVCGPDQNVPNGRPQVMEAIWSKAAPVDDAEIAACMGASYAFNRDWFGYLEPLHYLRGWGEDEIMLSVKSWLCGGDVRLSTGVRIGHKFRLARERIPYKIDFDERGYNKLFAILTLVPEGDLQRRMLLAFNKQMHARAAWNLIKKNWNLVLSERARNKAMFKRDFYWLAQKFGLKLP